ncbi:SH3 domain-containing protein [Sphingomonas bacterium]|uniref:SH3 domain-containing protein n=1 Tax=Sphingomonas bacterium TaxID=1895847 RepID=UPI00157680CA|nr:SH3 domain-containing protein [Sphingomonas bacterium]
MHRLATSAALAALLATPGGAQRLAKPSAGQRLQETTANDVPRCPRKLGTVSIEDGDDPSAWTQASLAPPSKLLKVLVARSGCFNLVDRGTGLNAANRERNIGGSLGLQRRSNVGIGQVKAADYVLVAEIQGANSNVSGSGAAAGIGGLVGGRIGGLVGGFRSKKMEANTILSLTNVRTTETIATEDGYAAKNNLSLAGGGFFAVAGGVGGGYDNTDLGRIVTLSFIQAYARLVNDLGEITPGAEGTAQAAPSRTYTAEGSVALRASASPQGRLVRTLPAGATVYPTGKKVGLWWEVADENDNSGWVINTRLAPTQ